MSETATSVTTRIQQMLDDLAKNSVRPVRIVDYNAGFAGWWHNPVDALGGREG